MRLARPRWTTMWTGRGGGPAAGLPTTPDDLQANLVSAVLGSIVDDGARRVSEAAKLIRDLFYAEEAQDQARAEQRRLAHQEQQREGTSGWWSSGWAIPDSYSGQPCLAAAPR
jgi:hypothetical protein